MVRRGSAELTAYGGEDLGAEEPDRAQEVALRHPAVVRALILMANAGVINATRQAAPEAWRRLVGFLLQAFAAHRAVAPPLPEAPDRDQIYGALMRLSVGGRREP